MPKHFLTGLEMTPHELHGVLQLAEQLKLERSQGHLRKDLSGKTLVLLFEKPSLRTHVSFAIAMQELGGSIVESFSFQRKKEEPEDVARVLAGYCHAIAVRTSEDSLLEKMASKLKIPIINALSDGHHPSQTLADLLTLKESYKDLKGLKIAWIGDGNNILHSLLLLAPIFGVHVHFACPKGYEPNALILKKARALAKEYGGNVSGTSDPKIAAKNAHALYTDVWTSMGFEAEKEERERAFRGFQINAELYRYAAPDALIMHNLPMVRGCEITDDMAEHANSVLFRQSENKLHAQKALLLTLVGSPAIS